MKTDIELWKEYTIKEIKYNKNKRELRASLDPPATFILNGKDLTKIEKALTRSPIRRGGLTSYIKVRI